MNLRFYPRHFTLHPGHSSLDPQHSILDPRQFTLDPRKKPTLFCKGNTMSNKYCLPLVLLLKGAPVSHEFSSQQIFLSQTLSDICLAESCGRIYLSLLPPSPPPLFSA